MSMFMCYLSSGFAGSSLHTPQVSLTRGEPKWANFKFHSTLLHGQKIPSDHGVCATETSIEFMCAGKGHCPQLPTVPPHRALGVAAELGMSRARVHPDHDWSRYDKSGQLHRFHAANGATLHCCEKKQVMVDLPPGTSHNKKSTNCHHGGMLSSITQNNRTATSQFKIYISNFSLNEHDDSKMLTAFNISVSG